ncbi:MAG TPA: hypothetical protein VK558_05030 [Patescibacteria group bacterium]|nr:hypothetical protein [Patescibacteria group bacterium]
MSDRPLPMTAKCPVAGVARLCCRQALLLSLVPLLFLAAELILRGHALPYWLWFNHDPSYQYLLNGMHVLEGVAPGHVDHPGTPIQSLVALVLWLSGGGSRAGIADAAFIQPELLLERASDVILGLDTLAVAFLGLLVWKRSGRMVPALLAQLTPFFSVLALKHGYGVKPEPMLLLAVLLLSAAMVEQALHPSRRSLIALGLVVGFGTACKITFAPIGLAPLLLLATWRQRGTYVAVAAAALAVFLIPAYGALAHMGDWIGQLATHSGAYGGGDKAIIDPHRYPAAFIKLFFARPAYLLLYFSGVGVLALRWRERRREGLAASGVERALWGVLAAQLVQMLLVAKQPSAHYVLPALELSGVTAALLWLLMLREVKTWMAQRRRIENGFVVLLAFLAAAQTFAVVRQDRELASWRAGSLSIDMARDFPACAHVYVELASGPSYAWFYNHIYGSNRYAARLKPVSPASDYYFLAWRGHLENWDGPVSPAALMAAYPCITIRGIDLPRMRSIAPIFGAAFDKAVVCPAGMESVLVAGATCPAAHNVQ